MIFGYVGFNFFPFITGKLALAAVVQINSGVPSCMSDQVSLPSKPSIAMLADKLLYVRVHLLVLTQSTLPFETLSTGCTNKRLNVRVRRHVLFQLKNCHERHVTDLTLKFGAVNLKM